MLRSSDWTGFGFSVGLTENLWSCECSFLRRFTGWIQSTAVEVIDQVSAIFFSAILILSHFFSLHFLFYYSNLPTFRSHHFNFYLFSFLLCIFTLKNLIINIFIRTTLFFKSFIFCSRRTKKNDFSVLSKLVYYWFPLWMETKNMYNCTRNITGMKRKKTWYSSSIHF